MAKISNAMLTKHGQYPYPVYVAKMDNGEVVRMSFWQDKRKPWDFDRGRRICLAASETYVTEITWLPDDYFSPPEATEKKYWCEPRWRTGIQRTLHVASRADLGRQVVSGHIDWDGETIPDPMDVATVKRRRVTAAQLKKALADILANGVTETTRAQAAELIAA